MRVDAFDFELPQELIALHPARPRDSARLLTVRPGGAVAFGDRVVRDLPDILSAGDLLVFNDTKVIPARLRGRRASRGDTEPVIDVTLHQRAGSDSWLAFAKPGRKLRPGDSVAFADNLEARVSDKRDGGEILLLFSAAGAELDHAIQALGDMPLPPYIASKRPPDTKDHDDYQTMFAKSEGAVAAPTAGLHFTPRLVDKLAAAKIATAMVTLHVGAGTFLPVKADDTRDHRMHSEWGHVPAETAAAIRDTRQRGGRVVSVGTTTLRILEAAALDTGSIGQYSGSTDIFITPGFEFKVIDVLMTNFHLPRSTLFMLVSAFSGLQAMKAAYEHAIAHRYRFYSFGDANLLFPAGT